MPGTRFRQRHAEVAGGGELLGVVAASLVTVRGPGQQLAQVIQRLGLAELIVGVAEQLQRLPVVVSGDGEQQIRNFR